jgi:hypothetical protein
MLPFHGFTISYFFELLQDNHALRQELKGRTEELQQMEKRLDRSGCFTTGRH